MEAEVTRILGLQELVVTAVHERGEELELSVESQLAAACCPHCGQASVESKERPRVRVRDLPLAGRRTYLLWRKRRYRCRDCRRSFSERHPELPARQRVSRRFRALLHERAASGGAHAEIARAEATSRYQVGRAFAEGAARVLDADLRSSACRWLSFDEAAHRRGRRFVTVVSDPERRRVLELLPGRRRADLERYLRSLPAEQRQAVELVSLDAFDAYRQAVRTLLPQARIVCDPFHLVRGCNEALDTVRRRLQRRPGSRFPGRQGRQGSFRQRLYRSRLRLLKARERLSWQEREALRELFRLEPELGEAWLLKEAFRAIYRAGDRAEAERRLERFLAAVARAGLPSFSAFANGLRPWREELLAYFDEPATNGYAEGVTNKIKVIKRRAYGLPSFESFRRRVLVACS